MIQVCHLSPGFCSSLVVWLDKRKSLVHLSKEGTSSFHHTFNLFSKRVDWAQNYGSNPEVNKILFPMSRILQASLAVVGFPFLFSSSSIDWRWWRLIYRKRWKENGFLVFKSRLILQWNLRDTFYLSKSSLNNPTRDGWFDSFFRMVNPFPINDIGRALSRS